MGSKRTSSSIRKYQQSFAYGEEEKRVIEEIMERHKCSFNSALRFIVSEFEKKIKSDER